MFAEQGIAGQVSAGQVNVGQVNAGKVNAVTAVQVDAAAGRCGGRWMRRRSECGAE